MSENDQNATKMPSDKIHAGVRKAINKCRAAKPYERPKKVAWAPG